MLIGYHLRLAYRSLRRDLLFSLSMVVCLALAASIWGGAMAHYLRPRQVDTKWLAKTHVVEAYREGAAVAPAQALLPGDWRRPALKLTWAEFRWLRAHAPPSVAIGGTYRGYFLLEDGSGAAQVPGRFVDLTHFHAFTRAFRWGGPWTAEDDRQGRPVVVLSHRLNVRLFGGGNSVGKTVQIEGRTFRVAGALAAPQPFAPPWDLAAQGADEDKFLVPLALAPKMAVRPESFAPIAPTGRSFDEFLAAPLPFVSVFARGTETDAQRLQALLASAELPARYRVQTLGQHLKSYPRVPDAAGFFALLCALVLIMGGFSVTRLLFAKSLARRRETGVHRALGASRASLFLRTMLESTLVSAAGAVLTLPLLQLLLWFFNLRQLTNDIPFTWTPGLALAAALPAFGVGLLAGLYPAWRVAATPPTVYLSRV